MSIELNQAPTAWLCEFKAEDGTVTKQVVYEDPDGLRFNGIERERKYFDIACERIARAQAQGQLLPPGPAQAPEQQSLV